MTSAAEKACALVGSMLADGPRDAAEIRTAAEGDNISERTIQRAAIALGVVKAKAGFSGGWTWRLPADEGGSKEVPTEQQASRLLRNVKVPAAIEHAEPVKDREVSEPSRAEVIAARLRKLEAGRGKKGPFYGADSRVQAWAAAGISDPDLREAYERAVTALEDARSQAFLTVGFLDPFVKQVISEGDKA